MFRKEFIRFGFMWLASISGILAGCGIQNKFTGSTTQSYPSKPINIIVPFSAGGGPDLMARMMAGIAINHMGQPMIVQNMPGGSGTLAWNELVRAQGDNGVRPDGYTIGVITLATILQQLYGPTKYNYLTAIDPITQITQLPILVAVLSERPWENINDLVEYAKQHPREIKYSHPGIGTAHHVAAEMFAKMAGINIVQVPFLGPSEALVAFLGQHVQLIFTSPPAVKQYLKDGRVRVLAISSEQRLTDPEFNSAATFKEQGLEIVFNTWYGIGTPKELPEDVKAKLTKGLEEIISDSTFRKQMEALDMPVEYLGPDEFKKKWVNEYIRFTKIVGETGIAALIASQKS